MQKYEATIRNVSSVIQESAMSAIQDFRSGDAPQEVDVTGRLLGAITSGLNNKNIDGIIWQAKTLRTGRGKAAEEQKIGADIVGRLKIDLPDYKINKGILIQAKICEPGKKIGDWERLEKQIGKMLSHSPDSFVMIYSKRHGVSIVPAISLLGLETRKPFDLYHQNFKWFFEQYLKCFIGDKNIDESFVARIMNDQAEASTGVLEISAKKTLK